MVSTFSISVISEKYIDYLINQFHGVPESVYVGLVLLYILGTVLLLMFLGQKKGRHCSALLLLLEYVVLLILLSVLIRGEQADREYDLTPFWSYWMIASGSYYLLPQIIANVVAFFPIGLLLGYALGRIKWWMVMLLGGALSALIEIMQFVLKRGYTEFDDVFHNMLGCLLGYGVYVTVSFLHKKLSCNREKNDNQLCIIGRRNHPAPRVHGGSEGELMF